MSEDSGGGASARSRWHNSVRETGDRTYRVYGLTGVPETYYIDRRGRIVAHSAGAVSSDELEREIGALLLEDGR